MHITLLEQAIKLHEAERTNRPQPDPLPKEEVEAEPTPPQVPGMH